MTQDGVYAIRVTNLSRWSNEDDICGFVRYKWQAKIRVREVAEALFRSITGEKGTERCRIHHPDGILTNHFNLVWDKDLSKNDCMTINIVRRENGWMYASLSPRYRITAEKIFPLAGMFEPITVLETEKKKGDTVINSASMTKDDSSDDNSGEEMVDDENE